MTPPTTPRAIAAEVSSLFSLPDLALRAMRVMDSPSATSQDLVEVIELDAALVATVLRLANSALYGHARRVETLSQAVAMLGHTALRDLVLATSAVKTFRDIPAEFVDMDTFWDNSVTCGVLARLMASYTRVKEAEALFLAGLLHGVGRLVFYVRRPNEYREVLRRVSDDGLALDDAEQAVFGFSQAELGAALLDAWNLPEKLCLAVRHQRTPDQAPAFEKEVALVHLAAELAANLAPCLKTDAEAPPYVPDDLARRGMALLGLTPAMLEEIRLESLAASLEVIEIIHPGATTIF